MQRKLALALLTAAIGSNAVAAETFDYNYVEAGFGDQDGGDTVFMAGSYDVAEQVNVVAGFYGIDVGFADGTIIELGAGMHAPLSNDLDAYGVVGIAHASIDCSVTVPFFGTIKGDCDGTDLMARGGLRFAVDKQLQFEGELSWFNGDVLDGLGLRVGARYYLDPQISLTGGFASDQEMDGLYIGARYDLK